MTRDCITEQPQQNETISARFLRRIQRRSDPNRQRRSTELSTELEGTVYDRLVEHNATFQWEDDHAITHAEWSRIFENAKVRIAERLDDEDDLNAESLADTLRDWITEQTDQMITECLERRTSSHDEI